MTSNAEYKFRWYHKHKRLEALEKYQRLEKYLNHHRYTMTIEELADTSTKLKELKAKIERHATALQIGKAPSKVDLTPSQEAYLLQHGIGEPDPIEQTRLIEEDKFDLGSILDGISVQHEINEQEEIEHKQQMLEDSRHTEAYQRAQEIVSLEDAPTEEQIEAIIERAYKAALTEYQLTGQPIRADLPYKLFEREYLGHALAITKRYLAAHPPTYSQNKQTMKP